MSFDPKVTPIRQRAEQEQAKINTEGFIVNQKGEPVACELNLLVAARMFESLAGVFFDEFRGRPMRASDEGMSIVTDDHALALLLQFQRKYNPRAKANQARGALKALIAERQRDTLREYIEGLPTWDGVARIESAFCDIVNAPDTPLIRAASANFFISMIARGLARPPNGVKVDQCYIFEGDQGILKSTFLEVVGGEFHAEISAHIGTDNFARQLRGVWVADMSELSSLPRADAETVKQAITVTKDRGVPKYEEHARDYIRRCIFAAGTNRTDYLHDQTGNRRFIPVPCAAPIRIDLLRENREQILAEALHLYRNDTPWWEFPQAEAEAAQEARRAPDPWEDQLRHVIEHGKTESDSFGNVVKKFPSGWVSSAEIQSTFLGLTAAQLPPQGSKRLGGVMRALGYIPDKGPRGVRGWKPAKN